MKRLLNFFPQEFGKFHLRLQIVRLLLIIFPPYTAYRIRVWLLRLIGFSIGKQSVIFSTPTIVGDQIYSRLIIGNYCRIGVGCYFDLAGKIIIHDRTVVGLLTTIITGTHEFGGPEHRTGNNINADVEIGEGVWIGARCTILPGVKIGNGVVIAAGAVVTKDVPDNVLIGGVPAKVLRELDAGDKPPMNGKTAHFGMLEKEPGK